MERKNIMLAYMFSEKKFNKMRKPVILQPKIEGDRCRNESHHDKIFSSGDKILISVPHILQELKHQHEFWKGIELDGELYKHGMRHRDIRSIVSRTKNIHPNYKLIEYHVFDVIDEHIPQDVRLQILDDVFKLNSFTFIKKVPNHEVTTLNEVQKWYDYYTNNGYEGIILRDRDAKYVRRKVNTLLKLKPRMSETFLIVGFEEELDIHKNRKNTLGALWLEDNEGKRFKVGTGITKFMRKLMWENKNKLLRTPCKIRFQNYTKIRGIPKMQSIDKEWLIATSGSLKKG